MINLSIRQLRAFVAVANLGSFTEAARRLHLTQSALSVLVKELEREVGVRLLNRTTRSVELSEAGKTFYPQAERTIEAFNGAIVSASGLNQSKRAVVRVSAPQLTACAILIPAVARFAERHPGVNIELADEPLSEVPLRVLTGEADLGISPDRTLHQELERKPLMTDPVAMVCRTDHPLARKRRVTWRELEAEPAFVTARDFARRARIDLGAEAANLHPAHEFSHLMTAFGMVQAGCGVTVGPTHAANVARAFGLTMRPLVEPEVVREFALLSRRGRTLSAAAKQFAAYLVDQAARDWRA